MAGTLRLLFSLTGILLAYAVYILGPPLQRSLTVLGVFRREPLSTLSAEEIIVIQDTTHCEDLHYYAPSNTLFAACEDNPNTRFGWFPPLATFDDPELGRRGRGSIHVIDPKTMKSQRLAFENFDTTFVTHGIDVIADPEQENAVYIFAINHLPDGTLPKARSQIEVFHHVLGSPSIRHIRSVWHPLIRTPNDVYASSPTSVYATNDHRYREGLLRTVEDVYSGAKWTDTVLLTIDLSVTTDSAAGVVGSVALKNMHNNNGLGHGRSPNEILIASAAGGVLSFGEILPNGSITVVDSLQAESVIDNPSYFADGAMGVSGFVLPGVARGVDLEHTKRDPDATNSVMVWFAWEQEAPLPHWGQRLLFEDDGSKIRSASAAVLVPVESGGVALGEDKKAWLFVTGFQSANMIAAKVDL
ncbi:hypothetical protein QBC34DRAFT_382927 [Podospora aff. communis PSN243]|uniref:Serum paraoxonase/arylesterase family protein n=1 Tax=Podospora aff. communis PSN243 TaxID=3040156 RepID=A0AAV9GFE6_9PEZI|nr:hypothetical protein QBC34DRAFT_382927 [Podospora aff. communis PSN243]